MKGRIIGREGRNIRAFEQVTGVNLIIDDTPEAVLLSCFDPVRREVGRLTLEALVLDGRIHPQRIEERLRAQPASRSSALCLRAAEDALVEVGITDLHPELVTLLGRLRYRTSYGQNVLKHLVESAHIAGADGRRARPRPGADASGARFLHDIGKALTHEVEGSHALIGAEWPAGTASTRTSCTPSRRTTTRSRPRTVEAVLTQAADAISGGRPGARRESLEAYVKRLSGSRRSPARKPASRRSSRCRPAARSGSWCCPTRSTTSQAQVIARDIAKQVEEELTYPGQIRVTVVRESRATELAR